MHFLFKVIIFFIIVFNFRVPIFYNSAFVSIIVCSIYYSWKRGSIPFNYFFQRYNAVILIGTVLLSVVIASITLFHNTEIMPNEQKRTLIMLVMLFSTVFALPLLVEGKESSALEEVFLIICSAFAIQGVISLAAYLYAPLGEFLISIRPPDVIEIAEGDILGQKFRYMNLSGTVLVELTAAFGVAFIVLFWMQLRFNHPYMNEWKKYLFFIFIFLGTVFSGRTGFFGLLFGLFGWILFSFGRVFTFLRRNVFYIVSFVSIILSIYYFVFTDNQRRLFDDEVFPFAFEWYYNYTDYGKYEVKSMDAMPDHYFYLNDETLLKGHGMNAYFGKSPYPHSDAGYMNNLIFGGIPFLIFLIIYQCLYFARPLAIALRNNSRENMIDAVFFLILFVFIFFVEIKAQAVGSLHIVEVMYLAIGSVYIMNYYLQKEQRYLK